MNDGRPEFVIRRGVELPACDCPYCAGRLDAATGVTGTAMPEPGDASVCFYCGGLLVFALDLTMREPDEAELPGLLASEHLMIAQRAAHDIRRRRPPPRSTI